MSETWIKEYCPKCKNINWIYMGSLDVDAIKCRICEEIFIPGDFSITAYMEEFMFDEIEDMNIELGKENPD